MNIGYDPSEGCLHLFDPVTKCITQLKITKLLPENISDIENVMNEIKLKIQTDVDHFCVYMPNIYQNNFRKEFIASAKNNAFYNVYVLSGEKLKIIFALMETPEFFSDIDEDIESFDFFHERKRYMIFHNSEEYCAIYLREVYDRKFRIRASHKKKYFGPNVKLRLDDLQVMKKYVRRAYRPTTALIYSTSNSINQDEFKNLFSEFKKIIFCEKVPTQWSLYAMTYARYLSKEKDFERYEIEEVLERSVEVKNNDDSLIEAPLFSSLSFSKRASIPANGTNKIKIFVDGKLIAEKIICSDSEICITLDIDKNGIYTVHLNFASVCITNKSVSYFASLFEDPKIFPATVNFNGANCKVGALDSPNSVKSILDYLGQPEPPKWAKNKTRIVYSQGYPELFFVLNNGSILVNPESAMAELLKKVVRKLGYKTYYLTIPRYFTESQREAYEKAIKFAKVPEFYFVDETTALAFGYKEKFKVSEKTAFAILQLFLYKLNFELIDCEYYEKEESSHTNFVFNVELEKNCFFDEIILNIENNEETDKAATKFANNDIMDLKSLLPSSIMESLHSIVITDAWLSDLLSYHYPTLNIVYIEDPSPLAALGAQQAYMKKITNTKLPISSNSNSEAEYKPEPPRRFFDLI